MSTFIYSSIHVCTKICRYMVGKVIGAGSFGIVREAVQRGTGVKFAVKSVPKVPKRGKPTPRYLLKLRQEVEAMQQLGASLDAVYLAVCPKTPRIRLDSSYRTFQLSTNMWITESLSDFERQRCRMALHKVTCDVAEQRLNQTTCWQ